MQFRTVLLERSHMSSKNELLSIRINQASVQKDRRLVIGVFSKSILETTLSHPNSEAVLVW